MMTVPRLKTTLVLLHLAALGVGALAGWEAGLLAMASIHLPLLACTLWTGSTPFCPARLSCPTTERFIVLTIDDGPCADTPAILELLSQYQAKAVFFVIGQKAAAQPEWIRLVSAAGHGLGNHTFTHPAWVFWAWGPAAQRWEISETNRILTEITGHGPDWFRAPAGFRNPFTGAILREFDLKYLGWSCRAFDTRSADVEKIVKRLTRDLWPGSILLIHQGHPHSLKLLERLLIWLASNNWSTHLPLPDIQS
jgi:peptidoglycan/xylan/chitin deacetylase (PgdA/CDA1 family)